MSLDASVRRDVRSLLQRDTDLVDSLLDGYIFLAKHEGLWSLRMWLVELKQKLQLKIQKNKAKNVDFLPGNDRGILRNAMGEEGVS